MISYSSEKYTTPIWQGNTVEFEMFWPIKKDDGEVTVKLAYPVDEVISLCNSRLEKEFTEGRDYLVKDGCIVIPNGSEIRVTPWNEIILDAPQEGAQLNIEASISGKYLFFSESFAITDRQCAVSYKHSGKWEGVIPKRPSGKLAKMSEKIKKGEDFTFAFFGDSITAGGNSSGRGNTAPFTPRWSEMVRDALAAKYPAAKINFTNTAVGGKETNWAISEVDNSVNAYKPDLLVLAFGMNDGGKTTEAFIKNTKTIIDKVLAANPDCEIAVIGTMLPHSETTYYKNQYLQEAALYEMAKSYANVDVVPVTSAHSSILEHKRYYDMTGNNVNHANDFLIRVYAQTILEVLIGE